MDHKNICSGRLPLFFMIPVFLVLLSSCVQPTSPSKPIQVKPSLNTVSKDDYLKGGREIELPQNYSTRNYKRLVVSVWFFPNKSENKFQDLQAETLSTSMETEISKLKRFTIVSRHLGQKAKEAEKQFQGKGTTNKKSRMKTGKGLNPDYSLSGGVSVLKEEFDRGAKNELIYTIRIDYQLIDNLTDEIVESDTAEGRARRTIMRLPSGKIIGGFNEDQEENAYAEASLNALKVVANKIGNKLPIGGRVIGFKGQRFMIDKGHQEGFMGKQTVTLYAADLGVDIAFAVGEVTPGDHKTPGKIIRWSTDPDAQDIIRTLHSDPQYLRNNDILAVSNGMPLPPEWDITYRDE